MASAWDASHKSSRMRGLLHFLASTQWPMEARWSAEVTVGVGMSDLSLLLRLKGELTKLDNLEEDSCTLRLP